MLHVSHPGSGAEPTLYEWAGGSAAFRRLINAFYDRVETDDLLSALFPGGVSEHHREHVIAWWSEVFGGPADYTETLGGYAAMVAKHRNLDIGPDQRFRFASLMSLAADDAELPSDPCGLRRLSGVGNPAGDVELRAWSGCRSAGSGPEVGVGRRPAVPAELIQLIRIRPSGNESG
jgi:truncated hemoglobin YjbI